MQVIRCNYCGNRAVDLKFSYEKNRLHPKKKGKFYCSVDCYYIENVGINLFFTVYMFVCGFVLIPFWILFLRNAIKGIKLRRRTDYKKERIVYTCYYCHAEINEIPEGKGVCMSCGEIIHYCDLCQKHIFAGDKILQLEPCGHIFHKGELLDWVDNNKICPKCTAAVDFVDIEPE